MRQAIQQRRLRLPFVWEWLRMFSGLFAIVVFGVAAWMASGWEEGAAVPSSAPPAPPFEPQPMAPDPLIGASQPTEFTPHLVVFYLVSDQYQASMADWGESISTTEAGLAGGVGSGRTYGVLYARDEAEEAAARRHVFEYVVANGQKHQVQVIDLRGVCAGP